MSEKAPYWVVPVMRTGYGARGAVYLVVGTLALMAAIFGGEAEGTTGAEAVVLLRRLQLAELFGR